MSMTTLVILRFLGIFAVYTGVTLALPALMFRRILRGRSLAEPVRNRPPARSSDSAGCYWWQLPASQH